MWTISLLLAGLILLGFGVAIYMSRKTKTPQITIIRQEVDGIDIEELATKVATAVANQMLDKLKEFGHVPSQVNKVVSSQVNKTKHSVTIDESIIPAAIETAAEYVNLKGMTIEEETEDKGLAESKSKLAKLKKGTK